MMKSRSWIKTMATSALMSPRAAFRRANNSSASLFTTDSAASSVTSIPLPMLATLTRVVQFLNENHLEEEGLYSKPGVGLERKELLRFCKCQQQHQPNLSVYSPHSIAGVIKEILTQLYEPLVPADISEQLLEAVSSGHVDEEADDALTEIFKQIRSTTREFLQVFLGHLHSLSANGSSRMSVTNLALHVGIALVRPTEDKAILNSKMMVRRRKCVAEFLIRQASSLPYDCATEMNIPAIPELVSTEQLHFVQVTWDGGKASFTLEQLEKIFGRFGAIENVGINDQGNRAIIAYVNARSAEEAERTSIPSVRVRRRKPRQGEKRREYSSHAPDHSRPKNDVNLHSGAGHDLQAKEVAAATDTPVLSEPGDEAVQDNFQLLPTPRQRSGQLQQAKTNPLDDIMVVEDIEDDQAQHEKKSPDRTRTTESIKTSADDNDCSALTSTKPHVPVAAKLGFENEETHEHVSIKQEKPENNSSPKSETAAKENNVLDGISATNAESRIEGPEGATASRSISSLQNNDQNTISDIKPVDTSIEMPEADQMSPELTDIAARDLPESAPLVSTDQLEPTFRSLESIDAEPVADEISLSADSQLFEPASQPLVPVKAIVENEVPPIDLGICPAAATLADNDVSSELLQSKLIDMETILITSTAALSSTKLSTEFERAVLQLHKQILDMVDDCLVLAGAGCGGEATDKSTTSTSVNAEFLDFLEAQAKTQVKILEVEVRAGQELLRLHKTQYEKERIELEEEITALRVGRTEAEKLCAELRTNLRKCRSELACHVANATDIQRQKSTLEEKLAVSETQLRAKEIALAKAQAGYDKMQRVAAEAQVRVEKFKQGDYDEDKAELDNQNGHSFSSLFVNTDKRSTSTTVDKNLPHTIKFLSKHPIRTSAAVDPESSAECQLDAPVISVKPSNVTVLEAMKQQMARDIQEQIASTKAALREMEICSSSGKTLQEEEEELRQLQQQLAARSSEMDTAMKESRTRLQELLVPTTGVSSSDFPPDYDEIVSNQEATIFDSTALVNELISRAEKATYNSSRQSKHVKAAVDEIFIDGSTENSCCAQYHRPTHEAQSVLYKKWTAERSRKMAQLASYRDQQTVLLAQQSMQTFQQTLAEVRKQR